MVKRKAEPVVMAVRFQGVSYGKETISVGVKVDRDTITDSAAIKTFVKRRLAVHLETNKNGDASGQMTMPADVEISVSGSADSGNLSIGITDFGLRLSFNPVEIDHQELALLHHRHGEITITNVGEIPDGTADVSVHPEDL